MDLGLKEIIITIMVGVFTIIGLKLTFFNLLDLNLSKLFRREKDPITTLGISGESVNVIRLSIFIGMAFGLGILVEDVSYKFVDNRLPFNLPSKYDTRIQSLIGNIEYPEITPLAKELARNGAFEVIVTGNSDDGVRTRNWILSDGPKVNPCPEESNCHLTNSILGLYYYSKNIVYTEANYYDEMKKIQVRSDFARSIALIALFYLLVTAFCTLVLVIKFISSKPRTSRRKPKSLRVPNENESKTVTKSDHEVSEIKRVQTRAELVHRRNSIKKLNIKLQDCATTGVILVVIIALSSWAYLSESNEFNKRAFGYFNSLFTRERILKKNAGDQKNHIEVSGEIKVQSTGVEVK